MAEQRGDNPAWRLHGIIERALTAPNGTIRTLWATAFETEPKQTARIFRRLALLHELEEVRAAEIDSDLKDTVLDGLEGIRRAIVEYRLRGSAGLREEV